MPQLQEAALGWKSQIAVREHLAGFSKPAVSRGSVTSPRNTPSDPSKSKKDKGNRYGRTKTSEVLNEDDRGIRADKPPGGRECKLPVSPGM